VYNVIVFWGARPPRGKESGSIPTHVIHTPRHL
jgi:hypothetical protein